MHLIEVGAVGCDRRQIAFALLRSPDGNLQMHSIASAPSVVRVIYLVGLLA